DFLRAGETDDAPGPFLEREDLFRVEPLIVVNAAFRIRDRDNPRTLLVVHEPGVMHADVPKALDRDGRAFQAQLHFRRSCSGRLNEASVPLIVPAEGY